MWWSLWQSFTVSGSRPIDEIELIKISCNRTFQYCRSESIISITSSIIIESLMSTINC